MADFLGSAGGAGLMFEQELGNGCKGAVGSELILGGRLHRVTFAELHVPVIGGVRTLFLAVETEPEGGSLGVWGVALPGLTRVDDLDGQRVRIDAAGAAFDDDTLGSCVGDAVSFPALSYWGGFDDEALKYAFADLRVDFERVEGRRYRCGVLAWLRDRDETLTGDAGAVVGRATLVVDVDERDPAVM